MPTPKKKATSIKAPTLKPEGKYHALPVPLSKPTDLAKASASVIKDHLKGQTIVVFVYSPMCGYCEAMRGEWNDAARQMTRNGIVVVDMDVRNTDNPSMPLSRVAADGMTGVPHLIAIRGNTIDAFNDERTSKHIQSWANAIRDKKPEHTAAPKAAKVTKKGNVKTIKLR